MSLPSDVQAILDRLEPEMRRAFAEAIARAASATQLRAVEDALRRGDVNAAVLALRLDPTFFAPLDRMLSEAYYQGGVMALAALPRITDPFRAAASFSGSTGVTPGPSNGRGNGQAT